MVMIIESENKKGVWIFDENKSGVFLTKEIAKDVLTFTNDLQNTEPGTEETFDYINASYAYSKQVVISDDREFVVVDPEDVPQFTKTLESVV